MTSQEAMDMKDEAGINLVDDGVGMTVVGDDEQVMAKVLCCNWTETSCFVHLVVKDPKVLEKNMLARELFEFTFGVRGCIMLLATASSLNEGSLALQKAYGFEEVCRIPDAFSLGEDMIISRLTRERYERRIH
jgi:L-amino acid N-acyltransferase YncA